MGGGKGGEKDEEREFEEPGGGQERGGRCVGETRLVHRLLSLGHLSGGVLHSSLHGGEAIAERFSLKGGEGREGREAQGRDRW